MKYILIILTIFSLQGFVALEAQSKPIKRTRASKKSKTPKRTRATKRTLATKRTRATKRTLASKKSKTPKRTLDDISKNSTALIGVRTQLGLSTGSGFFISESLLVTNKHVVEGIELTDGLKMVYILTPDKQEDVGVVILKSQKHDLAIIKTLKNYKSIKLGQYSKVKMGDAISIISSPQGLIGMLSKGRVSAKRKEGGQDTLQFTAPISTGSSGSPVLDKDLKVIGVSVAVLKEGQNINFAARPVSYLAVPVSYLKEFIKKNRKMLVSFNKKDLLKKERDKRKELSNLALKGDAKAQNELGDKYYFAGEYKKAAKWYKKSAEQGDASAQFYLGWMYTKERGVAQNYVQATYLFDDSPQSNLGLMYYNGQGVAQNYTQAAKWFKKSAKQGHAKAQYNLGLMYDNGWGVAQKYTQAVYWYKKSAEQGYAKAQSNLGVMYGYGNGQGVARSYAQAVYWFKKSAEQGVALAQFNLGWMHAMGLGVAQNNTQVDKWLKTQNYTQAAKWFKKSAKQAHYWYKKSAEQGDASAQYNLGLMYYNGQGVAQNYTQAAKWYKKSAEQGHASAQFNLSLMYSEGRGVAQNYTQAAKWYKKSAEQGHASAQFNLRKLTSVSK